MNKQTFIFYLVWLYEKDGQPSKAKEMLSAATRQSGQDFKE